MTSRADIFIGEEDGLFTVYCRTFGDTEGEAHLMAKRVLDFLAAGRRTYIRHEPSAKSEENFDTGKTIHIGCVRFSFWDTPGEWQKRTNDTDTVVYDYVSFNPGGGPAAD